MIREEVTCCTMPALCLINARLCSKLNTCWEDIKKDAREMVLGMYWMCAMVGMCVCVFPNLQLLLSRISHKTKEVYVSTVKNLYTLCSYVGYWSPCLWPTFSFSPICYSLHNDVFFLVCFFCRYVYNTANVGHLAWGVINRCDNRQNKCQLQPEDTVRTWPIKILHIHLKPLLFTPVLRTWSSAGFHSKHFHTC